MSTQQERVGSGTLMERLERQQGALLEISRSWRHHEVDLEAAIRAITEAAAAALDVERASVWLLDDARSSIRCLDLYEVGPARHSSGAALDAETYPAYFKSLEAEDLIVAEDAHVDPRTYEFSSTYLAPLGIGAMLDAPIRMGGRLVGVLCHEHVGGPRHFFSDERNTAMHLANLVSLALEFHRRLEVEAALRRSQKRLRDLATHDPLTALLNRRAGLERLEAEVRRASRGGQPLSVAMLDVDHFKRINDVYGHQAGDEALRALARDLGERLRASDIACRWGGEEFLVILPATSLAAAARLIEGMREHLARDRGAQPSFTISAGVAAAGPGRHAQAVIASADTAMYEAKRAGRNRVFADAPDGAGCVESLPTPTPTDLMG